MGWILAIVIAGLAIGGLVEWRCPPSFFIRSACCDNRHSPVVARMFPRQWRAERAFWPTQTGGAEAVVFGVSLEGLLTYLLVFAIPCEHISFLVFNIAFKPPSMLKWERKGI